MLGADVGVDIDVDVDVVELLDTNDNWRQIQAGLLTSAITAAAQTDAPPRCHRRHRASNVSVSLSLISVLFGHQIVFMESASWRLLAWLARVVDPARPLQMALG